MQKYSGCLFFFPGDERKLASKKKGLFSSRQQKINDVIVAGWPQRPPHES